jgi:hypothetical protein
MNKRKTITPKIKLEVLKHNNYACVLCGRSPVTNPGLDLEVDHIQPFSKEGVDELENFQTLCRDCNRGKGNNENLNKLLKNDVDILLNKINPNILISLTSNLQVSVVANQEDFTELVRKNNNIFYSIEVIPRTIIGFQSSYSAGIYTINDNYGQKVNFLISLKQ